MSIAHKRANDELNRNKPSMSFEGDNYDAWKVVAREKLLELLCINKLTKVAPDVEIEYQKKIENATEIRFTFKSEEDYRVPCHLLLPDGVVNPPVMICLQGHSTGMHISLGRAKYDGDEEMVKGGDRDFCIRAIKEGFACVALEQRNLGESKGTNDGPRCGTSALTTLLLGKTTIGERVWDVMRLIDVIEDNFSDKVDLENICLMGNSGGGTTTVYTAALEDRIVLAMPSCSLCTYKDSIGAVEHCACNYIPNIANYFEMSDLISMSYPKYFIQVNGVMDEIFPIKGAETVFKEGKKIYVKNGVGDRCVHVKGDGGHRFFADDSWPFVHKFINN